jgi:hypothetical protein
MRGAGGSAPALATAAAPATLALATVTAAATALLVAPHAPRPAQRHVRQPVRHARHRAGHRVLRRRGGQGAAGAGKAGRSPSPSPTDGPSHVAGKGTQRGRGGALQHVQRAPAGRQAALLRRQAGGGLS